MSAANQAAIFVAIVLAAACGRGAHFSETDPARGASGGTGTLPASAPDGGLVDGGPLADGGNLSCANRADLVALDGCGSAIQPPAAALASITSAACRSAFFFVSTTGTVCTVDTISGPLDAFGGAKCNISNGTQLNCSAPNGILPGVITCAPSNCTIRVCIQGQDGGC